VRHRPNLQIRLVSGSRFAKYRVYRCNCRFGRFRFIFTRFVRFGLGSAQDFVLFVFPIPHWVYMQTNQRHKLPTFVSRMSALYHNVAQRLTSIVVTLFQQRHYNTASQPCGDTYYSPVRDVYDVSIQSHETANIAYTCVCRPFQIWLGFTVLFPS